MIRTKSSEGYALWLYKIIAGCFIVVLLIIHLVVNHLIAPGGLLTYWDVLRYYTIPIVPIMEIVFLLLAISHALIGLRSIILDLNPSRSQIRYLDWCLLLVGVGASAYGVWLVLLLVSRGQHLA